MDLPDAMTAGMWSSPVLRIVGYVLLGTLGLTGVGWLLTRRHRRPAVATRKRPAKLPDFPADADEQTSVIPTTSKEN